MVVSGLGFGCGGPEIISGNDTTKLCQNRSGKEYEVSFDEIAGDCGSLENSIIFASGRLPPGCTATWSWVSDNNCEIRTTTQCDYFGDVAIFREVQNFTADASYGEGEVYFSIFRSGLRVCQSRYIITSEKVQTPFVQPVINRLEQQ